MKRFISIALSVLLAMAPVSAFAIDVRIDNTPLTMDVPASSINGRTMVPMRAIFEALGADITWDASTKGITATKDGDIINLYLNNNKAYINGSVCNLDAAPVTLNGRTMVPARFVAEAMGCSVKWDAKTQTVDISTNSEEVKANTYRVVRVVDGDTFVVDFNGTEEKVRLIGIDTAESVHPDASKNTAAGVTASEYTKSLLTGKSVELEFDVQQRDKYGRLLAYAYLDGYMLNKKLLEDGYAVVATYPPNVKYVDEFKAISKQSSAFGEVEKQTTVKVEPVEANYIGNANTKKFHEASCSSVKKMSEKNKVALESRDIAISRGFEPCANCNP